MMARFAKASLRADKNAARVKLPECVRKRASIVAQNKFTASAPNPVNPKSPASGAEGCCNFPHAVHKVANPGNNKIPAIAIPTKERRRALHPNASKIKPFTAASSRKSIESASRETEPICRATKNSTAK